MKIASVELEREIELLPRRKTLHLYLNGFYTSKKVSFLEEIYVKVFSSHVTNVIMAEKG